MQNSVGFPINRAINRNYIHTLRGFADSLVTQQLPGACTHTNIHYIVSLSPLLISSTYSFSFMFLLVHLSTVGWVLAALLMGTLKAAAFTVPVSTVTL